MVASIKDVVIGNTPGPIGGRQPDLPTDLHGPMGYQAPPRPSDQVDPQMVVGMQNMRKYPPAVAEAMMDAMYGGEGEAKRKPTEEEKKEAEENPTAAASAIDMFPENKGALYIKRRKQYDWAVKQSYEKQVILMIGQTWSFWFSVPWYDELSRAPPGPLFFKGPGFFFERARAARARARRGGGHAERPRQGGARRQHDGVPQGHVRDDLHPVLLHPQGRQTPRHDRTRGGALFSFARRARAESGSEAGAARRWTSSKRGRARARSRRAGRRSSATRPTAARSRTRKRPTSRRSPRRRLAGPSLRFFSGPGAARRFPCVFHVGYDHPSDHIIGD